MRDELTIQARLANLNVKIIEYENEYVAYPESATLNNKRDAILNETQALNNKLNTLINHQRDNIFYKDVNVTPLLAQINELQTTYAELTEDLNKPIVLEGNYETTKIQASANFSHFILYFLMAVFVIISLIFILKNPEVGNLDMFCLALAVLIIVYYIYNYYTMQKRK